MPDNLRNQIARLECPSELADGAWDGPIYVRLLEQRQVQPGEPSVFVVDDRSRRPAWLCQLIFYAAAFDDVPSRLDGMADFATTPVAIPLSRLTRPFEDLTRELQDRPLLLLYRFVRFNACYVSCGARSYQEVVLDVFLVGQVVAYFPANGSSFSTPTGASAQPPCGFMCVVALRAEVVSSLVHVVISSSIAWTSRVSRDEFIAGWCHGVAATAQPSRRLSRFRSRWAELILPEQPVSDIRRLLHETFVPPGSDSTVHFYDGALRVISEYGRIISVQPLEYARKYIGPNRPSTRLDESVDSATESPSDLLTIGLSRGRPLPSGLPDIVRFDECNTMAALLWRNRESEPSFPPVSNLDAAVRPARAGPCEPPASNPRDLAPAVTPAGDHSADHTQAQPARPVRTTMDSTNDALEAIAALARTTQTALAQQAAAQQAFQQQLLQQLSQPTTTAVSSPPARASVRMTARGRRESTSRIARQDRSRSPARRPHRSDRRSHSFHRHDSSRRDRSRSRDRGNERRSDRQVRDPARHQRSGQEGLMHERAGFPDSGIPHRDHGGYEGYRHGSPYLGRSSEHIRREARSPRGQDRRWSGSDHASPRSFRGDFLDYRSAQPPGRSSYHRECDERTPRGQYDSRDIRLLDYGRNQEPSSDLTGTAGFRPSQAELRVHQTARVGPRPMGECIETNLYSFWQLSALDRVSTIHHQETLRGQYRVTKVTAKMIFALDFGTRPLDHFLPPPARAGGERTVVHDSSTWSSGDTTPSQLIESIGDLRQTLQCLREVATEWYPAPVVSVFAAVHIDSLSRVLDDAPRSLVQAMVNLYTHVFTRLFVAISQQYDADRLVEQARAIMAPDSPDYIRLVRQIIDRGLLSTWARAEGPGTQPSNPTGARHTKTRAGASAGRAPRQQRTQASAIPENIVRQIPQHEGKAACLRFQTQKGCDFRNCKHAHALVELPAEVVTYLVGKHGPLATGHPSLSA